MRLLENAMLEREGEVVHRAAALANAERAAIVGSFMAQNVARVMREVPMPKRR